MLRDADLAPSGLDHVRSQLDRVRRLDAELTRLRAALRELVDRLPREERVEFLALLPAEDRALLEP